VILAFLWSYYQGFGRVISTGHIDIIIICNTGGCCLNLIIPQGFVNCFSEYRVETFQVKTFLKTPHNLILIGDLDFDKVRTFDINHYYMDTILILVPVFLRIPPTGGLPSTIATIEGAIGKTPVVPCLHSHSALL
jgi:hypothetical protein